MEHMPVAPAKVMENCYAVVKDVAKEAVATAYAWGKLAGTKAVAYYVILAQTLVLWLEDILGFNTLALLAPIIFVVLVLNVVCGVNRFGKK